MAGKGDTYRKVKWQSFGNNYDRIFGRQNGTSKEERSRESEREQHSEGDRSVKCETTSFQEGSMRYAEYIVQYHAPTTDH